jgi:hypothetical protein
MIIISKKKLTANYYIYIIHPYVRFHSLMVVFSKIPTLLGCSAALLGLLRLLDSAQ